MYTEFAFDPKVQMLSEDLQRRFVMILCLIAAGQVPTESDSEIAFALRLSDDETSRTKKNLQDKGLIDEKWFALKWDARQFKSDHDAAERKRQQRERDAEKERHTDVTTQSQRSHGLEQNRTEQNRPPASTARRPPKKVSLPDDFVLTAELAAYAAQHLPEVDTTGLFEKFQDQARAKGWDYVDWSKAFQNYVRNCKPKSGHFAAGQYPRHGGGAGWM